MTSISSFDERSTEPAVGTSPAGPRLAGEIDLANFDTFTVTLAAAMAAMGRRLKAC